MKTKVKTLAIITLTAMCLIGCRSSNNSVAVETDSTVKYYCSQTTLDAIDIIINTKDTDLDKIDYSSYWNASVQYSLLNDTTSNCTATYIYQCGDVVFVQALDLSSDTNYMYKIQVDTETGLVTNYVRYELAA